MRVPIVQRDEILPLLKEDTTESIGKDVFGNYSVMKNRSKLFEINTPAQDALYSKFFDCSNAVMICVGIDFLTPKKVYAIFAKCFSNRENLFQW